MTFGPYDASAPVFADILTNMRSWLDKAAAHGDEATLAAAQLAPDMKPLTAQYQMASDTAKNAVARLAGIEAPAMPDTETNFAELRDRIDRTLAFVKGVDPAVLAASADRPIELKFPNGMGYRWPGATYLIGFALPNFLFHAATAYAILRAAGVPLGKPDFLAHLGPPSALA